jgi:hypothetical protein
MQAITGEAFGTAGAFLAKYEKTWNYDSDGSDGYV